MTINKFIVLLFFFIVLLKRTSTSDMCLRRRNAASLPSFSLHMVGMLLKPTSSTSEYRVATLLAKKRNILYSEATSYVRRRVRFSIRGYPGTGSTECQLAEEDINLTLYKLCMTFLFFNSLIL